MLYSSRRLPKRVKSFFTDGVSSSFFITAHKLTRSVNTLHVIIKFKDEAKMQTNATKSLSTHIEFKLVICIYLTKAMN